MQRGAMQIAGAAFWLLSGAAWASPPDAPSPPEATAGREGATPDQSEVTQPPPDAPMDANAPVEAQAPGDTRAEPPAPLPSTGAPDAAAPEPRAPAVSAPTATSSPPAPATPPATSPAPAQSTATPDARDDAKAPPRRWPYLVIGGGPMLGPHIFGTEECRAAFVRCERTGTFLGLGANFEVRPRLWRWLYAHGRGFATGNVSNRGPVYRGAWGLGVGIGAYARRAFGRVEYVFIDAFGDNRFARPFSTERVGRVQLGHHAGLLSVGFRQPLPRDVTIELWGGLMLGPTSRRALPQSEPEQQRLVTFMLGLNAVYELHSKREPRERRSKVGTR